MLLPVGALLLLATESPPELVFEELSLVLAGVLWPLSCQLPIIIIALSIKIKKIITVIPAAFLFIVVLTLFLLSCVEVSMSDCFPIWSS